MMRSLYSGVSGLRTHQTRMDVIGNNIANVNTTAYQAKNITFSDMLDQTTQSATGPNTANGTAPCRETKRAQARYRRSEETTKEYASTLLMLPFAIFFLGLIQYGAQLVDLLLRQSAVAGEGADK